LLALVLLAGVAQAVEVLTIPDDLNWPRYVSGFDDTATGWTATIFYYSPEVIPNNYNLLAGRDFTIGPDGLLIEGFALLEEGSFVPKQYEIANVEGALVPIYFVQIPELYAGIADGKLTVKELEKMDSLVVGWADSYREVGQPSDATAPGHYQISIVASGLLEDGRRFSLHVEFNGANYNVSVKFED
jgi:hypothetical protein